MVSFSERKFVREVNTSYDWYAREGTANVACHCLTGAELGVRRLGGGVQTVLKGEFGRPANQNLTDQLKILADSKAIWEGGGHSPDPPLAPPLLSHR